MQLPEIRIDGHGHLIPHPHEIPRFMKYKKIFWVCKEGKYMHQDNWKRPITDDSFFLEKKIDWLEKNDINHEVILTLSQLYCNGMEKEIAYDVIRFQNDYNSKIQAENGSYFTCGFVIQACYIDEAIKELDRCVNELGLNLVCLPTHYLDKNKEWRSIYNEETIPIFEHIDKLGLSVQIHPYDGEKFIKLKNEFWRFHLIWMCAQSADAFHFFSSLDFANKFPNTRTCFAHGNQYGQVNIGRRKQGYYGRPDLFEDAVSPESNIQKGNVFFDSIVHDVYSFRLLVDRQSSNQIIAGIDSPYPLGEMESTKDSYPGKVIDEAVKMGFITDTQRTEIWRDNVLDWLCKPHEKQQLVNRITKNI
jgi:aminocarboxymuconate-semialdehyde decarboxylase